MTRNFRYWTAQETEVLVDQIILRQEVINGPLSSTVTKQAKLKAWEEVVAAIRRECPLDPEGNGSQKELKDVRKKWQNLLAEAKRAISRNKEYLSGSEVDRPFVLKPIFDKLSRQLYLFNDESCGNSIFPDFSCEGEAQTEDTTLQETRVDFNDGSVASIVVEPEQQSYMDAYIIAQKRLACEHLTASHAKRLMKDRFSLMLTIMDTRARQNLQPIALSDFPDDMLNLLTNPKEFL